MSHQHRNIVSDVEFCHRSPSGVHLLDINTNPDSIKISINSSGTGDGYVISSIDELRDLIAVLENYRDYRVRMDRDNENAPRA